MLHYRYGQAQPAWIISHSSFRGANSFSFSSHKKAMCDIAKARASKLPEDTNRKQSNGN